MRKAMLIAALILVLLIAFVVIAGYLLPVEHVASGSTVVSPPPERVYEWLIDVRAYPSWRSDVKEVVLEPASQSSGAESPAIRWRERGSNGEITFEIVESRPPAHLVTRIADDTLPFGGTWTFDLVLEQGGTRVTITERGQVFNPIFRFMSRFVFGHAATIDRYLADLRSALARQSSLNTRTHTDATR